MSEQKRETSLLIEAALTRNMSKCSPAQVECSARQENVLPTCIEHTVTIHQSEQIGVSDRETDTVKEVISFALVNKKLQLIVPGDRDTRKWLHVEYQNVYLKRMEKVQGWINGGCNFRKMPRYNGRLSSKPPKRLQQSPKMKEKLKEQKIRSKNIIQRLICKLLEEDVEVTMKTLEKKINRMEGNEEIDRMEKRGKAGKSNLEEDCINMLDNLRVGEEPAAPIHNILDEKNSDIDDKDTPRMEELWADFSNHEEEQDIVKQLEEAEKDHMLELEEAISAIGIKTTTTEQLKTSDTDDPAFRKIATNPNPNEENAPKSIPETQEKTPSPPPCKKKCPRRHAQTPIHQHASPALRKNATKPMQDTKQTSPTFPALRKKIRYTPPTAKTSPQKKHQ